MKWYKITDTYRKQVDMILPAHSPEEAIQDHNDYVWGPDWTIATDRYVATEVVVKDKE